MATLDHAEALGLSHRFWSPERVVQELPGLTLGTLAQWRYRQVGPPYRKLGARVVYPIDELDAWVEAQTHTAGG